MRAIASRTSIRSNTVSVPGFLVYGPPFSLTLLYVANTEKQTVAFNIQARVNFKSRRRARMGIWEAMEMLNTLVDESDPDVSAPHCTVSSEPRH
jgi:hypothetical protein